MRSSSRIYAILVTLLVSACGFALGGAREAAAAENLLRRRSDAKTQGMETGLWIVGHALVD